MAAPRGPLPAAQAPEAVGAGAGADAAGLKGKGGTACAKAEAGTAPPPRVAGAGACTMGSSPSSSSLRNSRPWAADSRMGVNVDRGCCCCCCCCWRVKGAGAGVRGQRLLLTKGRLGDLMGVPTLRTTQLTHTADPATTPNRHRHRTPQAAPTPTRCVCVRCRQEQGWTAGSKLPGHSTQQPSLSRVEKKNKTGWGDGDFVQGCLCQPEKTACLPRSCVRSFFEHENKHTPCVISDHHPPPTCPHRWVCCCCMNRGNTKPPRDRDRADCQIRALALLCFAGVVAEGRGTGLFKKKKRWPRGKTGEKKTKVLGDGCHPPNCLHAATQPPTRAPLTWPADAPDNTGGALWGVWAMPLVAGPPPPPPPPTEQAGGSRAAEPRLPKLSRPLTALECRAAKGPHASASAPSASGPAGGDCGVWVVAGSGQGAGEVRVVASIFPDCAAKPPTWEQECVGGQEGRVARKGGYWVWDPCTMRSPHLLQVALRARWVAVRAGSNPETPWVCMCGVGCVGCVG